MTSRLSFNWRTRPGAALPSGGVKTSRNHLDFLVDGQSLYDLLAAQKRDLVGVLGWCPAAQDDHTLAGLVLEKPSPLPGGRVMLFVCPECGDIGCGAITAMVTFESNSYVWRDFGYENNYDPGMADFATYAAVGPFQFDATQYRAALQAARGLSC